MYILQYVATWPAINRVAVCVCKHVFVMYILYPLLSPLNRLKTYYYLSMLFT